MLDVIVAGHADVCHSFVSVRGARARRLGRRDQVKGETRRVGDAAGVDYLLPLARLCVWQSIVRFDRLVAPPFDQAVTWSASISVWA